MENEETDLSPRLQALREKAGTQQQMAKERGAQRHLMAQERGAQQQQLANEQRVQQAELASKSRLAGARGVALQASAALGGKDDKAILKRAESFAEWILKGIKD